MRLFNPRFEKISETKEITYYENVIIRNGFCEAQNSYAIAELKRRGFIEVAGSAKRILEKTIPEIAKEEISRKKEASKKRRVEEISSQFKKDEKKIRVFQRVKKSKKSQKVGIEL